MGSMGKVCRKSFGMVLLIAFLLTLSSVNICSAVELPEKPIISYYYPRAEGQSEKTNLFSNANIIDVKHGGWTPELRDYWKAKGKIILVRKMFASKKTYKQKEYNEYLLQHSELYDGMIIDEVVLKHIKHASNAQLFVKALKNFKEKCPEKLLIVYSASKWNKKIKYHVDLLKGILKYSDLLVEQVYVGTAYSLKNNWKYPYFDNRVKSIIDCGGKEAVKKLSLILGVYSKMRDEPKLDFGAHMVEQIKYVSQMKVKTRGIGIYAPLYAKENELKAINEAVGKYILKK